MRFSRVAVSNDIGLDGSEALPVGLQLLRKLAARCWVEEVPWASGRVSSNLISVLAAEQLADRHTEQFSGKIPKSDFDSADRSNGDASNRSRPAGDLDHLRVQPVNVERVFSKNRLSKVSQDDFLDATPPVRFAKAGDPGVGLNLDQGQSPVGPFTITALTSVIFVFFRSALALQQ